MLPAVRHRFLKFKSSVIGWQKFHYFGQPITELKSVTYGRQHVYVFFRGLVFVYGETLLPTLYNFIT